MTGEQRERMGNDNAFGCGACVWWGRGIMAAVVEGNGRKEGSANHTWVACHRGRAVGFMVLTGRGGQG
jgi:hypothetical protein